MKVLQIVPTVSLSRGDFMVVMNYYRNMDKSSIVFDFAMLYESKDNVNEEIKALNGNIFKLPCPSILKGAKQFKKELNNILSKNDYDIIHLHMPTFQGFVKSVIKNKNIKLVIHSHSTKLAHNFLRSIRNRLLICGINKNVDGRLACTELAGKNLFGKGFLKRNNDKILTNAINLKDFQFDEKMRIRIRRLLGLNSNDIVVCNVGRFVNGKNHERLIDIFNILQRKQFNLKLCLIGDGCLKDKIVKKIRMLKLENKVILLGNRNDVNQVLQGMDIFVFPSSFEGLGIVLIEAQAAGLLCFASEGCPKDVEVTKNIFRIPLSKSDEYWANLILSKSNKEWNKNTIAEITQNNYNIVDEANKLLDIYKSLIKR